MISCSLLPPQRDFGSSCMPLVILQMHTGYAITRTRHRSCSTRPWAQWLPWLARTSRYQTLFLTSTLESGDVSVSMAADKFVTDAGDLFPAHCPAAAPCCLLALALSTWPIGVTCPVTLYLPPAVNLRGVAPHATSAIYPEPPAQVSHWLIYAGGPQWSTWLGAATTVAYLHRVFAHPGQPPTSYTFQSKAAGPLYGLPQDVLQEGFGLLSSPILHKWGAGLRCGLVWSMWLQARCA